jgi:hypothetical protein
MSYLITAALLFVATIHLLPLIGVVGVPQLRRLYGLNLGDPNLEILLRHRAVLFGLLGAFLAYAALKPTLQAAGIVAGFISVASFIVLAKQVGRHNAEIGRVLSIDFVALALLLVAGVVWLLSPHGA